MRTLALLEMSARARTGVRRRLAARLIDMKSNVFSAKMSLVENVEHRKRRSETLRAKLTAFARGERFVDGDGVHTTHS